MRNYEIIFMFNPEKSDKINNIIEEYKKIILKNKGIIYRIEDWGRKQMSYSINKIYKSHYILINIKISQKIIKKISTLLQYDKSIIRYLIIKTKNAITKKSIMMKNKDIKNKKK